VSNVEGMDALLRRMKAIGEPKPVLRALQLSVIHEAQALAPHKTGNLQRSMFPPGELTNKYAIVVVRAKYGRFIEEGTGLFGPKKHRIVPKTKKALHWTGGGPSKVRLSGRSRVVKGKSLGEGIFATSTKGAKAQPFFKPGYKKAVEKSGLADIVIAEWNGAA